jgi:FlaA1/EpsC-like NDP-sugar epimerase
MKRKADAVFALLLGFNDLCMIALAFYLAYWLRNLIAVPPAVNIAPFGDYLGMLAIQLVVMSLLYFFTRLYDVQRSMPRLDEFYRIFAATSIGTLVTIALTTFLFKNSTWELDCPRAMVI